MNCRDFLEVWSCLTLNWNFQCSCSTTKWSKWQWGCVMTFPFWKLTYQKLGIHWSLPCFSLKNSWLKKRSQGRTENNNFANFALAKDLLLAFADLPFQLWCRLCTVRDSRQTSEESNLTVVFQLTHWLLNYGINFSQKNGIICQQSEWEQLESLCFIWWELWFQTFCVCHCQVKPRSKR